MSSFSTIVLLFCLSVNLPALSQTLYLIPFQNLNHIKDSTVQINVERKQDGIWKDNGRWKNTYLYGENGLLTEALVLGQRFIPKYKKGRPRQILVYDKKKKQNKLIYHYDEKGMVNKIGTYLFLKGSPKFWGSEYLTYDSLNNVISSSYTIESNHSSHTGYSHNAMYVYDFDGRMIFEDWGYKQIKHFFGEDGKIIEHSIISDNEFGPREYRRVYNTYVTKYE